MRDMLPLCVSWQRGPSSVALPEVSYSTKSLFFFSHGVFPLLGAVHCTVSEAHRGKL